MTPEEIIGRVQEEIAQQLIKLEYFVTLFYARFDLATKKMYWLDCGSTKPIHYHAADQVFQFLEGENLPLGILEKETFDSKETFYGAGDLFIFYSDGVSEARTEKGELFGVDRLLEVIRSHVDETAQDIVTAIRAAVMNFSRKEYRDDDLTLVVVKIVKTDQLPLNQAVTAKFNPNLSQLKAVRDLIRRFCLRAGDAAQPLSQSLQLAVNEIFCNLVKHGYDENSQKSIVIHTEVEDEGIVIDISDQGRSFNPAEIQEPNLVGEQDTGFGWSLIRQLVDKIAYTPKLMPQGWNHLRIYKHFIHQGNLFMNLEHKTKENILIVTPQAETLDAREVPEFKEKLISLISDHNFSNVVLDLGKLQFIDSSGLGSFLSILRLLHTHGAELKLAQIGKPIRTMFELVSMHKVFEIYNTTDEALNSFK